MTTTDLTTTARTAAKKFDMDEHAAIDAAREYLTQISEIDGQDYDEDELPTEVAEFILESIAQSQDMIATSPLDEVADTRDRLEQAKQEHHDAIRRAAADGAPKEAITNASAYTSRQTIYDIIDGKK